MKRHLTFLAIAFLILVVAAGFLPAQVAGAGDFNVPTVEYPTIQDGIDAAFAAGGGTVHVAAGTYYKNITLKDGVEVLGAGEAVTTIDGSGLDTVVTAVDVSSETKIDGFTITHGKSSDGGGMRNENSSPVVTNCTFSGNWVKYGGGGMCNISSDTILINCTFSSNSADCGGGICNYSSDPALTGCTFSGNSAGHDGGGMYNNDSSPTATSCAFSGNSTYEGGGMYNNSSDPTLTGCTFSGNSVYYSGGGMFNNYSTPTVTNCIFSGNSANHGGGIFNVSSGPTVTNCTFYGNSAEYCGGGLYFYANHELYPAKVTNCILWDDIPDEIYNLDTTPTVSYSDVYQNSGIYTGTGNINSDPLFVDPDNGDFHLQYDSPCIDSGTNSAPSIPAEDFEGDGRILDGDGDSTATVDMGVDEYFPRADLEVAKMDSPDPVMAGGEVIWTIVVTNHGPSGAGDVVLTDDMPLQVEYLQYSPDSGNSWSDWSSPLSLGTLASEDDIEILIRGTVDSSTEKDTVITNTAEVSSVIEDPDTENNSSTSEATVDTSSDLEVTKTGRDRAVGGGSLIYTITVT
ncbi:MAG: DUF11 domain-containing protein, partial [Dehalococcoidales bacterium]|nr:DUF11 domain-containing protein [Dehalococcoidales bacterium]